MRCKAVRSIDPARRQEDPGREVRPRIAGSGRTSARRAWTPFALAALLAPAAWAADAPSFAKDVAPIFAKNCIGCHASGTKLGALSLSTYEEMLQGGHRGPVVAPGKSAESRLYLVIAGKADPGMPLGGEKLAAGEIETIRKWIDAGAKGPAAGETVRLSSAVNVPEIRPRVAVKPQIFSLAFQPGGKMIALGGFREVRLRETGSSKVVRTLGEHADAVRSLAFSRDGTLLAAAGGLPGRKGEVRIWSVEDGKLQRTIEGHADCIYAAAFSPDARTVATSSYDKLIKIWEVASGRELRTLKDHIDAVYALAFTPDGTRLISGAADRTVKIWNPATGERLYTMGEPADGINAIAIHPTGKLVAAAGLDKSIRVWSLGDRSGTLLHSLIAHEDAILRIAWSSDGKLLASASADGTIKVFRAEDLTEIKSIGGQPDWVYGIEFSPDGKLLAAGRFDGSLSIYDTQKFNDLTELRTASR
ncbi:MAG: hypothetical protein HYZ57_02040 [Acidobacteria bacterium]|nr:hypothetical protein [Acidobacteriota bacterium]